MTLSNDIANAIRQLARVEKRDDVYILQGLVQSVDDTTRTCKCNIIGLEDEYLLENIELMAGTNDGLYIKPAVNSLVYILISTYIDSPFVIQYSEIDKIILRGGMINNNSSPLVEVNGLIKAFQTLINVFNNHTHTAGSYTSTVAVTGLSGTTTQQQTVPNISDISNSNITQG